MSLGVILQNESAIIPENMCFVSVTADLKSVPI